MTSATVHLLGAAAAVLALTAAAVVIVLHVVRSDVDPTMDGVSAYALGPFGYLYRIQVVATGLAALLLALAFLASGVSGFALALLALFGISRVLIARYPTDPRGTTSLSRRGRLHIILATVSFLTIAFAAPWIAGAVATSSSWVGPATALTALGWATTIFALGTFASATTPATKRVFGLVERGAYASTLAWVVVAAGGVSGLG